MALRAVSNSALTAKPANKSLQPFRARRRVQFATVRSRGLRLDVEPLGSPSHRNMRLPSAERAVVDEAKVRGYLLAAKHPVSRFKAAFFRTLVYTPTDWLHLQQSLVAHALTAEAIPESASPYGQKFRIRAMLQGPGGDPRWWSRFGSSVLGTTCPDW